ncbi:hypothetical protein H6F98_30605 [Microcoleus sp. FACHB-SPT15]|uniref:hypothetical protein n=1 Tax=Microcoleus sp. FACHB-SPT15 TaxID=2692830 RepID=UPI00178207F9|nr:hypothetical protein [Microcoleus sp. FACHB-SPT15]MBD1809768.1 hypothetical protein [Microcoleus sp. FACHB-SPT15]
MNKFLFNLSENSSLDLLGVVFSAASALFAGLAVIAAKQAERTSKKTLERQIKIDEALLKIEEDRERDRRKELEASKKSKLVIEGIYPVPKNMSQVELKLFNEGQATARNIKIYVADIPLHELQLVKSQKDFINPRSAEAFPFRYEPNLIVNNKFRVRIAWEDESGIPTEIEKEIDNRA